MPPAVGIDLFLEEPDREAGDGVPLFIDMPVDGPARCFKERCLVCSVYIDSFTVSEARL